MTRRHLLRLFAAAPAALALDPERLLWVPGKKLISVPKIAKTLIRVRRPLSFAAHEAQRMLNLYHSSLVEGMVRMDRAPYENYSGYDGQVLYTIRDLR